MRRVAMRSALSAKAANEQLVVVDRLALDAPKTKEIVAMLQRLNVAESALILLPGHDFAVERSARNLPDVKTLWAGYLNVRDLLGYRTLVLTQEAVAEIERILS
jgi:large subunit ribosomal protein L4